MRLKGSLLHPAICLWAGLLNVPSVLSKRKSGDVKLSGLTTEHILDSFAVAAGKMGYMKARIQSRDPYQLNKDLFVRLIEDDQWPLFQNSPSCTEKVPHSTIDEHVTQHRKGEKYEAEVAMPLRNEKGTRSRYFYFVITDCSLEFYMHDKSIPKLHYRVETWNDGSHVSADESHLKILHTVTLLVSLLVATLLGLGVAIQLYDSSSVHAAMFWVLTAAVSDTLSSALEVVHLNLYAGNGVGSYFLDALSAHLEATCDALVMLLLLSVAAGWTLPSDVVRLQQNETVVHNIIGGLKSPFASLAAPSKTSVFVVGIIVSHIALAQWGRVYNDDFDSYHDLAHLPGKVLMLLRSCVGLVFVGACFQTRVRCPLSLHGFYVKFASVGALWFFSLPVLTVIVNTLVGYHRRHFAIGVWSASCQSTSIVLLSWLVTAHSTSYHKVSHMSVAKKSLADSLNSASITQDQKSFSVLMGKAKVRLD